MSVINKMLKDLDKRGAEVAAGEAARGAIRFAPENDSKARPMRWVIWLLVLALGGACAWWMWGNSPLQPAKPVLISAASPPSPAPPVAPTAPVEVVPPLAAAPAVPSAPAVAVAPALPPVVVTKSDKTAATVQKPERPAASKPAAAPVPVQGAMKLALSGTLASIAPPETRAIQAAPARERAKRGAVTPEQARMSKETSPEQQADNAYANAVSLIESGRKSEAVISLENLLTQNPRHASARQTLVGLLLDAKRTSDAARVLQEGLRLDPSRTGMAMVLARVQVETGDTKAAIANLQRSLPYAAKTPEYQAFLAALYQREKRHGEAIDHYRIALRLVPGNGLWWMGYGISLQAENRLADARNAFVHARDTERLTPELQAFVEQKISQLK